MTTIERFFKYLEIKGLKHTPVEKQLGLSNGYLGKMKTRKASIGSDIIEKIISNFTDLNLDWLITGKGNPIKSSYDSVSINNQGKGMSNTSAIKGDVVTGQKSTVTQTASQDYLSKIEYLEKLLAEKNELLKAKDDIITLLRDTIEAIKGK